MCPSDTSDTFLLMAFFLSVFSHVVVGMVWHFSAFLDPSSLTAHRGTERTKPTGCDARRFPINPGQGLSLFAFFFRSLRWWGDIRSFVIGRCSVLCMHCVSVSWSLNRRRHVMITITGTSASVSATVEKELVLHPDPAEAIGRMGTWCTADGVGRTTWRRLIEAAELCRSEILS